jgi:HK97 gp10 family phage protein
VTLSIRTNLPDFSREMERLAKSVKPIASSSTRAGARQFAKYVRQTAPKDTGRLRKAVIVYRGRRVGEKEVLSIVGIRQGKAAQAVQRKSTGQRHSPFKLTTIKVLNLDAYYWKFLEAGFIPRGPGNSLQGGRRFKKLIRERTAGRKIQREFIAPAFKRGQSAALRGFYVELDKQFIKAASR